MLRLYRLSEGLWIDEISTWVKYGRMPIGDVITTYDSQNQHFLYTILAKAAFALVGESAWALRLPAAIFGVGSVVALYLFAARVRGSREALLAAALLTFSYHHVWFSQNARGYIGLLFWTLLSSWALLRALDTNEAKGWVGYAFAAALGAFTLPTMIFVIVGQFAVYAAWAWRERGRPKAERLVGMAFGFVLAGLLTIQLYALVLPQMFGGTLGTGGAVETWQDPLWAIREAFRGLGAALPRGPAGVAAALGGVVIFGLGCARIWRRRGVVLVLLFLPSALTALVVVAQGHHLWPRFFFFGLGFAIIVVVAGGMAAGARIARSFRCERRASAIGTALVLGGLLISALSVSRAYGPKQDFEGALQYVEHVRRPEDTVLSAGLAVSPYRDYLQAGWRSADTADALIQSRSSRGHTWLVYTFPSHLRSFRPAIWEIVERDFVTVEWFPGTLGGGVVLVARR